MAGDFSQPEVGPAVHDSAPTSTGSSAASGALRGQRDLPRPLHRTSCSNRARGRQLTFDERVPYQTLLATGGNETTAQLLSNLVLLL